MRPEKKACTNPQPYPESEQIGDAAAEDETRETSQAERAVMRPDRDDPEWRYYHQIWQS